MLFYAICVCCFPSVYRLLLTAARTFEYACMHTRVWKRDIGTEDRKTPRHGQGKDTCIMYCTGKRDSIHHHLLEVTFETTNVLESRQQPLYTNPSGWWWWWWWCIESVFRRMSCVSCTLWVSLGVSVRPVAAPGSRRPRSVLFRALVLLLRRVVLGLTSGSRSDL